MSNFFKLIINCHVYFQGIPRFVKHLMILRRIAEQNATQSVKSNLSAKPPETPTFYFKELSLPRENFSVIYFFYLPE